MARPGSSGRLASNGSAPAGLIASLSGVALPFEIDRGFAPGDVGARPNGVLTFCFGFQDVPFQARSERRDGRPWLKLVGDLGSLPFSIENPRRRRRLLKVLHGAQAGTTLQWEVDQDHRMRVIGEIELGLPLTPMAVIAGAATLLVHCRPYIDLVVKVASEA
ncbi:MAG TPA: hypothetical protein VJO12_10340 [Stellaceae bacterium]|nr:hypothetical protein [Stellaceae bacterium]